MPHDEGRTCWPTSTRAGRRRSRRRSRRRARPGRTGTGCRGRSAPPIFLRAAELLAGPWRDTIDAATMLGQSKTAHQAEIDAACELIDFCASTSRSCTGSTRSSRSPRRACGTGWSTGPLEGFVFAISPFNFTAIGGNLTSLARAHGQHRHLEARVDRDALRLLRACACSRRPACRPASSTSSTAAAPTSATPPSRASTSPASTSPAPPACSRACGRRSGAPSPTTAATRASSARPAARTSSSRTRPRTSIRSRPRSCAGRSSTRARSARRPRGSTFRRTSGRSCASGSRPKSASIKMGDVSDFGNFMGAVIDGKALADPP